jgi:hypothetical protein
MEEISKEFEEEHLYVLNPYDATREHEEFWAAFWKELDSWDVSELKSNEKKVYEAIHIILKDMNSIEIFNKKAIYLYMREITGLTTKQIVAGLKKFKVKYFLFTEKWNSGEE